MPSDRTGEPWAGATYNGFSGPGAAEAPPPNGAPPPAPRLRLPAMTRKTKIIGGVATAVALGLVMGLWARPQMGPDGRARDPLSSSAEAATPPSVPIEVNRPQPPPAPRTAGRMEVLPSDMAQQARASAPAPRAEVGVPQDAAVISPQIADPPEVRLSRPERRALRDEPPPVRVDPRPLDEPPPPDEDSDPQ